jgi:glycerol-3-phosphate dehydrogenase
MVAVETEVLIIGGGALGCAVARELSKYRVDVTLVEKEADFSFGITKANAGIVCQGKDTLEFRPEYLRSRLLWRSMSLMEPLCRDLEVKFERIGAVECVRDLREKQKMDKLRKRTASLGLGEDVFFWREELLELEPNLADNLIGGLHDPEIAIVNPIQFTQALAENARENGVRFLLETEVREVRAGTNEFRVRADDREIRTRHIVNAAGENIDRIARLAGADEFVLFPVKGLIGILDKKVAGLVRHLVIALPEEPGEMNVISPTVDGNLLFGIQLQLSRRGDHSATAHLQEKAIRNVRNLIKGVDEKDVINFFAGYIMFQNYELGWHECVVDASRKIPRWVNVSIGYPGISAAPGAAEKVAEILQSQGLKLEPKSDFNPRRKAIPDFDLLTEEEKNELIKGDPRFGRVVCRCETVTEGEVVEAIRRGAGTLDGVKFRTRAGMGRCQGGFCGPRVTGILARELGIPETGVTKKGPGSRQLLFRAKELLKNSDDEQD